jgi:uncharacterized protein YbaA (DUF1428 family)
MNTEKELRPLTDAEKALRGQGGIKEAEPSRAVSSSFEEVAFPDEAKAEDPENVFIDPEKELSDIAAQMEMNRERIAAIKQAMGFDQKKMDEARASLGLPSLDSESKGIGGDNEELRNLEEEQERLNKEKENAEREKGLEDVLKLLNALPKTELKIIIETGKGPDGKAIKTPDGKEVNPDVAKKLAEAAENGVTKLTKALLGTLFAVVKGFLQSIFAAAQIAKEAAESVGGSGKA